MWTISKNEDVVLREYFASINYTFDPKWTLSIPQMQKCANKK